MTLVYAKIIGMFVCGADPGGRGRGRGRRGVFELFTRDCGTHIAVGRDGAVQGWGNDGGGEGGWGQALIEDFEQNRYHYIDFGYQHAHDEMKSALIVILRGFPQFWQEIPVL